MLTEALANVGWLIDLLSDVASRLHLLRIAGDHVLHGLDGKLVWWIERLDADQTVIGRGTPIAPGMSSSSHPQN